jgi:3-methyladenine DNA glycosylase AlkD
MSEGSERLEEVMGTLRGMADPAYTEGMDGYGINTDTALGIRVPQLRKLAKEIGRDHDLAIGLWDTRVHEALLLATMVGDPKQVTEDLMEAWVLDIGSWDLCDLCMANLFDRTPYARDKASQWSEREEEYVKRAGFVLMATMAVHDKMASDQVFIDFLPMIEREAWDERNFVKKAVNWALRQIGKRNLVLNARAIEAGERIHAQGTRPARWIASDALRELRDDKVRQRLEDKAAKAKR